MSLARVLASVAALCLLSFAGCAGCGVCPDGSAAASVRVATIEGDAVVRSVTDEVELAGAPRAGCAAVIGSDELVLAADGALVSLPSGSAVPAPALIAIAADDVDGDDVDEIIGVNDLGIFRALQGDGALREPTQLAALPEGLRIPQLVDFDGDGLLDVVGAIGPRLVILRAPSFTAEDSDSVDVAGDAIVVGMAVDDVDRDGDRDVVVAIGPDADAITELAVVDDALAVRARTAIDLVAGPLYVENGTLVVSSGRIKVMEVTLTEFGEPGDVIIGNFGGVENLELADGVFARVDGDGARDLVVESVVDGEREVLAYPRQGLGFNSPTTLMAAPLDAACLAFAALEGVAVVCAPAVHSGCE